VIVPPQGRCRRAYQNVRSAIRAAAGAFGFRTLIHEFDRPIYTAVDPLGDDPLTTAFGRHALSTRAPSSATC
jgi:hypothetical protein